MKVWITEEKNILWEDEERTGYFRTGYFYDAFWNPPPYQAAQLGYEPELWGWMILE